MQHTVQVRNVTIGEGIPKIIVPLVGKTTEEILEAAKAFEGVHFDIVEWRVDYFEEVFDTKKVKETAGALRENLRECPLLFTFRTKQEGGKRAIEPSVYEELNCEMARSGLIDLLDVEAFMGDDLVQRLIACAHDCGVKVIASNHDFFNTPPKEEILRRLTKMQVLGADIPKIAVMPNSARDVLTLLAATEEMASEIADRPIITMSMAGTGLVSRLAGETFGSSCTFGAVGAASAPGQMKAGDLGQILELIHTSI